MVTGSLALITRSWTDVAVLDESDPEDLALSVLRSHSALRFGDGICPPRFDTAPQKRFRPRRRVLGFAQPRPVHQNQQHGLGASSRLPPRAPPRSAARPWGMRGCRGPALLVSPTYRSGARDDRRSGRSRSPRVRAVDIRSRTTAKGVRRSSCRRTSPWKAGSPSGSSGSDFRAATRSMRRSYTARDHLAVLFDLGDGEIDARLLARAQRQHLLAVDEDIGAGHDHRHAHLRLALGVRGGELEVVGGLDGQDVGAVVREQEDQDDGHHVHQRG